MVVNLFQEKIFYFCAWNGCGEPAISGGCLYGGEGAIEETAGGRPFRIVGGSIGHHVNVVYVVFFIA